MHPDFLVVGAGVAGLRAAIELSEAGRVLVIAKDSLRESSSEYAQGGIAVALSDERDVEVHERDTLAAGDGLCDPEAVRVLVGEGPARVRELIEWGAEFDRSGEQLAYGREGAHTRRRILHAHGDSTGREIVRALYKKASSLPNIEFRTFAAVTDLLVSANGEAAGVVAYGGATQSFARVEAGAVLIATGGLGRVYRNTTNPDVATGDGVAMAYRAGAEISDLEFVQFHPTALKLEGAPPFLLSEAMRGEGGRLINGEGERFMGRYHPMMDLAPRDVVARAIVQEIRRTGRAFLDLTALDSEFLRRRFPRIYDTCLRYGLDLSKQPAPVHPAAHYAMGGVRTDMEGRSSLRRLYAAGEAAWTGVHGANRLASNSLLEGLVFGARAGAAMREWAGAPVAKAEPVPEARYPQLAVDDLRALAWEKIGIVRCGPELEEARRLLEETAFGACAAPNRELLEARSIHQIIALIARCALAREESRGAHYRTDFPGKRPDFAKHSLVSLNHDVTFV